MEQASSVRTDPLLPFTRHAAAEGFRSDDVPQGPDGGWFGVHLCEGLGKIGLVRTLVALRMGRFQGLPGASSRQARAVDIQADRPFAVETDGEVVRTRRARFHLLPGALLVCP